MKSKWNSFDKGIIYVQDGSLFHVKAESIMIKGQRVYLRAIREDDIDRIARCFQNEEIMYMTGTRNIFTKEHIKEAIQRFKEDASRYDFAICSIDNDQVIGDYRDRLN